MPYKPPQVPKLPDSQKVCMKCSLHETCSFSNKIPGRGSNHPTWMFVGQNPGQDEDKQGECFVGRTGNFLVPILRDLKFDMKKVRLTNAVRCWSGLGNPAPNNDHVTACKPYLMDEIKRYKPKVIVILGATALKAVTGKTGITRMRGTAWQENGTYYVAAIHPAGVMRDMPGRSEDFVHDMELARDIVGTGIVQKKYKNHTLVESFDEAMDCLAWLEKRDEPLFTDYETKGSKKTKRGWKADPFAKDACCLSVAYCWKPGYSLGIPLLHRDAPFSKAKGLKLLARINLMHRRRNKNRLESEAYQAVFDLMFPFVTHKIAYPILAFDPYTAHHLLDEERKMPGLSQLTWNYLDMGGYDNEQIEYVKTHPECDPKKGGTYDNIPFYDLLGPYNCCDTDAGKQLVELFTPMLEEQKLMYVYKTVVLPATYPVVEYHINGIRIDRKLSSKLAAKGRLRMEAITEECRRHPDVEKYERRIKRLGEKEWDELENERIASGKTHRKKPDFLHVFNPGSDDDCRAVLFDIAKSAITGKKIQPIKFTAKGKPSVDKESRAELMDDHVIVGLKEEYSALTKFVGTYVEKLLTECDDEGIYRGFYDLTGTVTGRMVSDLQQLPRGTTNEDVRKCIISRFGKDGGVADIDVSQGEVRVWAICSKDKMLRKAFKEGKDVHRMSASWAFKIPEKDVTEKQRDNIKSMVTFGIMYRRRANALAADMKWSVDKAQEFIDNYFAIFKGVWEKGEYYANFAKEYGYLLNMFNRRRRLPDAMSNSMFIRERALRQGVNFPIQSTLHDIMLYAQYQIWKRFKQNKLRSLLCGETHDGLIIDYYKPELKTIVKISKDVFDKLPFKWIDVPMVIEIKTGPNLFNMEEIA